MVEQPPLSKTKIVTEKTGRGFESLKTESARISQYIH